MATARMALQLIRTSKKETAASYEGQALTERIKDGQWLLDAMRAPIKEAKRMMIDRWETRLRAQGLDAVEYVQEKPQSSESKFQDPTALEESRWLERPSRKDDWPYEGTHLDGLVDMAGAAELLGITFHKDGVNTTSERDTKFVWFEHHDEHDEVPSSDRVIGRLSRRS